MQAFTFWAPGLLSKLRVDEAQEVLKKTSLPALQTLLAKADMFPTRQASFFASASYLLHQPKTLPVAATLAKQLLSEFDANHFWVKVDPVQMIADRDSLVLIAGKHLAISIEESHQLIKAFNEHFQEDGVELLWGDSCNWFLSIKQPIDINTTELNKVDYQPINAFLPTGNAAQYWRQLINETQMLFFNHPVNEQRREQGYPEINSVWIWGEGKLESEQIKPREDAVICSQNNYLQGVAKMANSMIIDMRVERFSELEKGLKNQQQNNPVSSGIVMLESLYSELDALTLEQWHARLMELEKNWFEPLLTALKQKQIESLLIDLGGENRYHLKPSHLRRFWRFKKALNKL